MKCEEKHSFEYKTMFEVTLFTCAENASFNHIRSQFMNLSTHNANLVHSLLRRNEQRAFAENHYELHSRAPESRDRNNACNVTVKYCIYNWNRRSNDTVIYNSNTKSEYANLIRIFEMVSNWAGALANSPTRAPEHFVYKIPCICFCLLRFRITFSSKFIWISDDCFI